MKKLLLAITTMIGLTACANTSNKANDNKSDGVPEGKAIVVYFSHPGENYGVGNIKEGNTKLVADMICEATGADRFEIVAEKDYDMSYDALCDLAKQEQQAGELPPYMGDVENLDQYTTVFIGGPVWWGTYPQVMFTFFKKHDLSGKTIVPFTTHEGSGLGNCVSDLKSLYPNATFLKAFSLYGHDVRKGGKKKVTDWLSTIGY